MAAASSVSTSYAIHPHSVRIVTSQGDKIKIKKLIHPHLIRPTHSTDRVHRSTSIPCSTILKPSVRMSGVGSYASIVTVIRSLSVGSSSSVIHLNHRVQGTRVRFVLWRIVRIHRVSAVLYLVEVVESVIVRILFQRVRAHLAFHLVRHAVAIRINNPHSRRSLHRLRTTRNNPGTAKSER